VFKIHNFATDYFSKIFRKIILENKKKKLFLAMLVYGDFPRSWLQFEQTAWREVRLLAHRLSLFSLRQTGPQNYMISIPRNIKLLLQTISVYSPFIVAG